MARRLGALFVLVATVLVLRRALADDPGADLRGAALAIGFALIAATLAGELFERIRLPRISGYLLFGLACGPYGADLISRRMAADLQLVNGLAIALIAFIAGLEINLARLRERLGAIVTVGAWTLATLYVLLGVVLYAAWPWLPIAPEAGGMLRLGMTLVLTTVLVSFSPTVTIAVVTEARARGPLTELALAVVVLADLALILGFALVLQFMRTLTGLGAAEVGLVPYLSWDIFGLLALGAMVGALFAFYLRLVGREVTVVLLAMCVLLSAAGSAFHVEPLLSALAAGLVVENIAPPEGDALRHAVERGALPVLVVFFAAAGASLHLDALATFGPIALGLAALRMAGIWLGVRAGVARAGMGGPAPLLWMGLVSQAGVTLGLTIIVANEFAGWGPRIQTLVVALIAIHELIGPILFRNALARAGEVGMMDVESTARPEGELQARPAAAS